ncbi:MAG: hemerythrin domain-containing protein [Polyangiaceae bacterium]|jgi:hemerythrin
MKPSEIRRELLEQHAGLRSLIEATCRATESAARGEGSRDEAADCLARVVDALRRHNLREEDLLRDLIPTVDPWGPARAEIMTEEHIEEHRELFATLVAATEARDPRAAATLVRELREHLLEHMAREEKGFLGEDALHDDDLSVDAFGG